MRLTSDVEIWTLFKPQSQKATRVIELVAVEMVSEKKKKKGKKSPFEYH